MFFSVLLPVAGAVHPQPPVVHRHNGLNLLHTRRVVQLRVLQDVENLRQRLLRLGVRLRLEPLRRQGGQVLLHQLPQGGVAEGGGDDLGIICFFSLHKITP